MQLANKIGLILAFGEFKATAGDVESGKAKAFTIGADGCNEVIVIIIEQGFVCQGAGRDDSNNLPLHGTLAGSGITDLFADGDGHAKPDESCQVAVDRVVWHAAHGYGLSGRGTAGSQGNVEQICGTLGIVVEQLVEIAHAVKQQFFRMFCLDGQVLLHHRCMLPGRLAGRGVAQGLAVLLRRCGVQILREFDGKKKRAWRFSNTVHNTVYINRCQVLNARHH